MLKVSALHLLLERKNQATAVVPIAEGVVADLTAWLRSPKKQQLRDAITAKIERSGNTCDLNHIDISQVKDFDGLFVGSRFNGDISQWDVSHVESMVQMFGSSSFNGDISRWDVSNVKDMRDMFENSHFNQDISNWNVSQVEHFEHMFGSSHFNGDISKWDVSRHDRKTGEPHFHHLHVIFLKSKFFGDLKSWNVPHHYFSAMFGAEEVSTYFHQRQIIEESTRLHQQFNSHTSQQLAEKRRKTL
jgi:surface protein